MPTALLAAPDSNLSANELTEKPPFELAETLLFELDKPLLKLDEAPEFLAEPELREDPALFLPAR